MLLNVLKYDKSLGITPIADGEDKTPDVSKIRQLLASANSMSHSQNVVRHALAQVAQELSPEVLKKTGKKPDFSKVCGILHGEIPASEFVATAKELTMFNAVFSFVGKSGQHYTGTGPVALARLNTEQFNDFFDVLKLEGEEAEMRDKIMANKDAAKKEFGNYRNAMLFFTKYLIDPTKKECSVTKWAKELQ